MPNSDPERINQSKELPSFVKLAMMYMGIMAGLAIIGLVLFLIASRGEALGSIPRTSESWSISVIILSSLVFIPLLSLALMTKRIKFGCYLAFVALVISLFAPSPGQIIAQPISFIPWLAIPNTIVGILLLKDSNKI